MSLSSLTLRATFNGNGATTAFALPFTPIYDDSEEVKVYIKDTSVTPYTTTLQVENTDYTLTGAPSVDDFHTTVTFTSAPASTKKVIIIRILTLKQYLDASANGTFRLVDHEQVYDRVVAMAQQLNEKIGRAAILPVTSTYSDLTMEDPEYGTYLGWNEDEDGLVNYTADEILDSYLPITEHTFTDGQSATNLTDETVNGSTYTSTVYEYEVIRGTTVFANGRIMLQYLNSTWRVVDDGYTGDTHGLTFSVSQSSTTAQLKLAADSGAGNGTIKLKKFRFEA